MNKNPYVYHGALDPVKNAAVCVKREKLLKEVTDGIKDGKYYSILGPRQIGKTTFLRQIREKLKSKEYPESHFIYIDFEDAPTTEKAFYQWFIGEFTKRFPQSRFTAEPGQETEFSAASYFSHFIENFQKEDNRKIVLLFDEVDGIPFLESFLRKWRKVHTERGEMGKENLRKFCIVVTGAMELVEMTVGRTSPFNIAGKIYMEDYSKDESRWLIESSIKPLGIKYDEKAIDYLIEQTSGHPQILQHACHLLVQTALESKVSIKNAHIDEAIEKLFLENDSLALLKESIKRDERLRDLLSGLLDGKKLKFLSYFEYSFLGAGVIKKDGNVCIIRNPIFLRYLTENNTLFFHDVEKATLKSGSHANNNKNKIKRSVIAAFGSISTILGFIAVMIESSTGIILAIGMAIITLVILATSGKNKI